MKYVTLILLLVVTSCASRPKPQVTVRPMPAPAVESAESVRYMEIIRAYIRAQTEADYHSVGISVNIDGPSDRTSRHRVFVVVEPYQAGLRDRCRHRVESVEPAGIGNELWPFRLEHIPDRLLGQLRMAMHLGVGNALSSSQAFNSS